MLDDVGLGDLGALAHFEERTRHLAPLRVRRRHHRGDQHGRVAVQDFLDLDAGDVLAAGDDDVLAAVLDLHVAVRVHHGQVAGVEPAAAEGLGRGLGVLQVALHHDVAAEEDLAHRLAVGRHGLQRLGVEHGDGFLHRVRDTLACVQAGALADRQVRPLFLLRADRRRAVDLGQAVDVGDVEADALAAFDDRGRRRGPGDQAVDRVLDAGAQGFRRIDQQPVDDRRAAQVRDVVLADQREDQRRIDPAQADAGAGLQRHRPGEAPAVAVEHRQRPQVDRVARHRPGDDVGGRVQVGAAVVRDDALGVAGRAAGVVQRDGVPLVARQRPGEGGIALFQEGVVFLLAEEHTRVVLRVRDVDHQRLRAGHQRQRALDRGRELAVGEQHLGFAVVELEGDRFRVEPGVERVQHGARHRHAEVAFVHRRRVRQHRGHRVAGLHAAALQRARQLAAAAVGLGPGLAQRAVDDGDPVRVDVRRAFQKTQRAQGDMVGAVALQSLVIGSHSHVGVSIELGSAGGPAVGAR